MVYEQDPVWWRRREAHFLWVALGFVLALCLNLGTAAAADPCDLPVQSEIACENSKPGDPESEWDVSGAGNPDIQGFATDISVDQGQSVRFKVDTDSTDYRLDIYRMGYYGGLGARQVATVEPSASLPQAQPACGNEAATGLIDCGNWAESASWDVPADAVSGIYFAKLVREDEPAQGSHIVFIVRDDDGGSDVLFQTMDTTWQAYNQYGGNSLYTGSPAGRAYKVSYNRPFTSRGPTPEDWVFNAEYPMVRWLEANGYDVSYFTGVDSDRRGAEILEHEAFLSVGHDEYWSGGQRDNVEAARSAGVDLAFFSGNEAFWKTRWEDDHRTLVSYKETHANAKIDPTSVWTGTWRDPRAFNPEGPDPENALTGTIFTVNCCTYAIEVPAADGKMRLWRNTSIAALAPGQTATLAGETLGYEWDEDLDNGSRPAGLVRMSSTTVDVPQRILDHGSNYGPGEATHHLTLYRHPSGALVFGAGTVQWAWGLDGNHDRGGSTPDPRMRQATVNLLADMGAQPASLQAGLAPATASTDAAAPSSQIASPNGGNVESGQTTTISGTATDAGGGEVGGVEVSTNGGTTWHPAEGRANWSYSWTPGATGNATIKTRAADDSANLETPGPGVTVNVVPRTCPCSIWDGSVTPPLESDPGAVELGVKFRSDDAGFITGLRFYKGPSNTGTHVGHLWASDGTLLSQATFSAETASGWQEVELASPVPISADTTYIASYHAPNGDYAASGGFFSASGTDSPPLHALAAGVDGPNGVYKYGASGSFPNETFNSTNYWVDVVFDTDLGPDETPPEVDSVSPAQNAIGVGSATNVTATFSEGMNAGTITGDNFELRDASDNLVPASVSYAAGPRTATLDPNSALQHSSTYTATVKGGATGVKDDADPGNPLASDFSWSFSTAAPPPPPPDEGPGGPILVISDASNPFGRYYAEILRAEGLNEFTATDISTVNAATLDAHDVVILAETPLSAGQAQMLGDWVQAGGNLIAMRPDPQLSGLLGLDDTGATLPNGYLDVDTSSSPGAGIVDGTIQYHGAADLYLPVGAETIASLYSNATTQTSSPAVTLRSVGSNGGQAAAFTYDLARSIVYTRQGNPAWEGQERDGQSGPIRPDDLFFGNALFDPQPDWVDLNKVAIPQADEQQRLLANLIGHMNLDRMPLPRFWFLPRSEKAAIVMTGDDHANNGTAGRFDHYRDDLSTPGCSVADWECVRGTSYIYTNTPLSNAEAAAYEAQGFEVALHVNTNCANWTSQAQLESFYSDQLTDFANKYTSVPEPSTNRTHCIAWSDWATQPKVELAHGIRLDTNYYYWPPSWIQDRPGMFTGSGAPMRFADLDGTMIDVYQAATQMTDESGQSYPLHVNALLDKAIGPEGYYGVFTANMHTDNNPSSGSEAIVASAQSHGVPVVTARQMLEWLDGRNGSSFNALSWSDNKLEFSIAVGAGANGLRAMVPTSASVGALTGIKRDGAPIASTTQTIKGVEYAFFEAIPGSYEATYAVDDTAPVISNVTADADGDGTATVTWATNEASDSRVDYGTNPASLTSSESSPALVTSHSVELTGLDPNTTYHYRVTSRDAADNTSTQPPGAAPPASFTTPSASFTDTTVSDFGAGTTGPDTYVSETGNGELILKPTVGEEFSGGPGLPAGWQENPWNVGPGPGGGSATVSGGGLHVDGASAGTAQAYGAGRSLEFVATFGGANFQHVGFGVDFNDSPNWAMFSVKADGSFNARTNNGGAGPPDTQLSSSLLGSPHRYRIEWAQTQLRYFVDGNLVATHDADFGATQMRPLASDLTNNDGAEVSVDWLHMSPFPGSGSFDSRVFDAGQQANWGALDWTAVTAPATGVALSVRTGDTPTPDETWTDFTPIASPGGSIGASSRYVQYRADLSSSDPTTTPTLSDVTIDYGAGQDTTPPTIVGRSPAPGATDVARDTNVEVGFSEQMDANTIDAASFLLHREGAGGDVAANVTSSGATATLNPDADLAAGKVYELTVKGGAGGVKDVAGNALGGDDTWTFTTAPLSFTDTTVSDFGAGTTGPDTHVSETGNGELILKPTVGEEFSGGPGLPAGWSDEPWTGGSGTVAGGKLVVDGARANTDTAFAPSHSLEFVATFGAAPFQHVGFSDNFESAWAIFSTNQSTSQLQARTNPGGVNTDIGSPGEFVGSSHRYRIEWTPTEVRFFVDGNQVANHPGDFTVGMRPIASDFNNGGSNVTVDWLHMSPFPGSGSFDSRVFDAGPQAADWGALDWTAQTPPATGVALSVRTGDTPSPDETWTDFTPIASPGGSIGASSRYIQYRADLSSSDPTTTPTLSDVTFDYGEDSTPPAAPQITDSDPDSPANDNSPEIKGSAAAGSTVKLYKAATPADCTPANLAQTGTAAEFAGAGITVTVPDDQTTTLRATATDAAANESACSAPFDYSEDSTPPAAPQITDSDPDSPANDNSPEIKGSAEAGSTVRIYKAATAAACTPANLAATTTAAEFASPGVTVAVAGDTTTKFRATAADGGGTSACSAPFSYTEDSKAPNTTVTSGPLGATNNASPSFEFTSSQANSSFECRLDSTEESAWQSCSSPQGYSNLATGPHTFEVRATDLAGNTDPTPAKRKFNVDTQPPNTTITSGPQGATNNASPSFEFTSSQVNSSFECRLDSTEESAWQSCSSPQGYSNLATGPHTFEVRATDLAGNTDPTPAKRKFNVDTQPPNTTITSGPQGATNNASPSFEFTSSQVNSSFECRLDSTEESAWQSCSSPQGYSNLATGPHTFEVRATDLAGNTDPTPATRSFTVSG